MTEQTDIILQRAENSICPICTCECHEKMVYVEYKGHKILVCKHHIKEEK